jgi:anaerobic magnesium-protoporphyrin IX monomethyl ester cyclase
MMFRGTYSSEFYRAIRDLLHAQVSLQMRTSAPDKADSSDLRHSLEQRWQRLLATESQHRTPERAPLFAS